MPPDATCKPPSMRRAASCLPTFLAIPPIARPTRRMRPETLAGDNVHQAIPVDINQGEGVWLGELDAVTVFRGVLVQDDVLAEGDVAVLPHLLVPGEPVTVRVDACDHVV